jgi:hypothetical protein
MSDYTQTIDFSAKDALPSGNPAKLIKGSDFDSELGAISTAIATKYDSADLASQAQAEAESSNAVLMTPLRVANWADYNAGIVGDLQALADPNADRILFWDDSAGAAAALEVGTGLAISGTTLAVSSTAGILEDVAALADPGADSVMGWDESANAEIHFSISTGLTTSGTALLIDTATVPLLASANVFGTDQKIAETAGDPRWWLDDGTVTASFQIESTNDVAQIGSHSAHSLRLFTNNTARLDINSSGNFDFKGGTVTTNNGSASEVGFKGMPVISMTSDASVSLGTAGGFVYYTGAGGHTLTIPANGSVAMPVGTVISFFNNGSGSFSIAITTDVLIWAGPGSTGTRTIALYGQGVLTKIASNAWTVSGVGIS